MPLLDTAIIAFSTVVLAAPAKTKGSNCAKKHVHAESEKPLFASPACMSRYTISYFLYYLTLRILSLSISLVLPIAGPPFFRALIRVMGGPRAGSTVLRHKIIRMQAVCGFWDLHITLICS